MSTQREFELREEHLKLLEHAYVSWNDVEHGAPEINPKRPYGDSGVAWSMAEILGIQAPDPEDDAALEPFYDRMRTLHEETQFALQIVLCTRSFQPGRYRRLDDYDTRLWERIT